MKPFIDVIPVISTLETEFYREYWRRCEVPLLPGARAGDCEHGGVGQFNQSRLLLLLLNASFMFSIRSLMFIQDKVLL